MLIVRVPPDSVCLHHNDIAGVQTFCSQAYPTLRMRCLVWRLRCPQAVLLPVWMAMLARFMTWR